MGFLDVAKKNDFPPVFKFFSRSVRCVTTGFPTTPHYPELFSMLNVYRFH